MVPALAIRTATIFRVQTIQLIAATGVLVSLAIIAVLRAQRSDQWAPLLVVIMSMLMAIAGALLVVVLSTDVVPDEVERVVLPMMLFVIAPAIFLAAALWARSRS